MRFYVYITTITITTTTTTSSINNQHNNSKHKTTENLSSLIPKQSPLSIYTLPN